MEDETTLEFRVPQTDAEASERWERLERGVREIGLQLGDSKRAFVASGNSGSFKSWVRNMQRARKSKQRECEFLKHWLVGHRPKPEKEIIPQAPLPPSISPVVFVPPRTLEEAQKRQLALLEQKRPVLDELQILKTPGRLDPKTGRFINAVEYHRRRERAVHQQQLLDAELSCLKQWISAERDKLKHDNRPLDLSDPQQLLLVCYQLIESCLWAGGESLPERARMIEVVRALESYLGRRPLT